MSRGRLRAAGWLAFDEATTVLLGPPTLALPGVVALATVVAARAEDGRRERARGGAAQPRPAT